ncbi:MAG TPA: FAD-dependent monooxygenase [Stackebrandtia sp.]|uniref:FAD-dependent monooxygenase n=1 Tax=Stackebrandtia sp. TaxID=2023065 RepID=UPI002D61DFCC|nr:FAD-dependent monooxygenase [Stackebrandtia sp.]HZE40595.1 FAD-dependent monooxygenase [Stackebrandtia sp.]
MSHRHILISGAGIAGLGLAHWLRRYGINVTVVERAPGLRGGGQAIDIRGTAREVITRMGLMDAIRAHHTGTRGIAIVDTDNRRRAAMDAESFGDSGGIVADIEILRGDLVRILHDSAGDSVEYLFDDLITAMSHTGAGVEVDFARSPTRRFDAVVGADGLRSGVRRLAFGDDANVVHDLGHYMSYFPAHSELDFDGWELMCNIPAGNGVNGRVGVLYPIRDTGEVRALLGFVCPPMDPEPRDVASQKELLLRVFAGAGWEFPSLMEQLRHTDDVYFARVGEVRVDGWSRGRAVLLGDACCGGSLGMGTSMALVGAYVLAGEIAIRGDLPAAFASYQEEMREYAAANMKRPPGGANGFAPRTRRGIWARTTFMRVLPHLPGAARMFGSIQKNANLITLKDYESRSTVAS